MKTHFRLFFLFSICFGSSEVNYASTLTQCPNLSNKLHWTLENDFIHYQNQMWYVSYFWHKEITGSGGDLPVPIKHSELTHAQLITLIEELVPGKCKYEVKMTQYPSATLEIELMGH